MWECGLKLKWEGGFVNDPGHSLCGSVDWNCKFKAQCRAQRESLLMWECGLKPYHIDSVCKETCHSLCGSVDWNILQCMPFDSKRQSLLMWECGLKHSSWRKWCRLWRHSLCGSVDWNSRLTMNWNHKEVTPYVGVWIETNHRWRNEGSHASLLMWECGLKPSEEERSPLRKGSLLMWECGLKLVFTRIQRPVR